MSEQQPHHPALCIALDSSDRPRLEATARAVAPSSGWLKLGLEAFTAFGPDLVRRLVTLGPQLFLDLKLHDIPNTVARAAANCAASGAAMFNVHACGGRAMIEAAVRTTRALSEHCKVLGVTVLTSLDGRDLAELGYAGDASELVLRLARLVQDCGADGVVASAREAEMIRRHCGDDFLIVTPGIRPSWAVLDDQRRVLSPAEALRAGANILVVGRPVTKADDPAAAAARLASEMIP